MGNGNPYQSRLAPARRSLLRQLRRSAWSAGAAGGLAVLPKLSLGLTLGYGISAIGLGSPLFPPLLLPLCVALVPAALALATWFEAMGRRIDDYDAARAVDRAWDNKDRIATAVEFMAQAPEESGPHTAAMAQAAIEDGLASLERCDAAAARWPLAPMQWSIAPALLALAIACLPLLLHLQGAGPAAHRDNQPGTPPEIQTPGTPRPGGVPEQAGARKNRKPSPR